MILDSLLAGRMVPVDDKPALRRLKTYPVPEATSAATLDDRRGWVFDPIAGAGEADGVTDGLLPDDRLVGQAGRWYRSSKGDTGIGLDGLPSATFGQAPFANGDSTATFHDTHHASLSLWCGLGDGEDGTGNINAASTTLTIAGITTADAGKHILITGAGADGADLLTTIVTGNGTTATLADAASTSVTGAAVYWGTDYSAGVQAALTYCETNKCILDIPARIYHVLTPPVGGGGMTGLRISGKSRWRSVIRYLGVGTPTAVLELPGNYVGNHIEDLCLDGRGHCSYGIYASGGWTDGNLARVILTHVVLDGFAGNGWNNEFRGVEVVDAGRHGIVLDNGRGAGYNNANRIYGSCKFSTCGGFGVVLYHAHGTQIIGNTFDHALAGAVYEVCGCRGTQIKDNYYEVVGETGWTFTTPSATLKALFVVNGSENPALMANTYPCLGSVVDGGSHVAQYGVQCELWNISGIATRIRGLYQANPGMPLVKWWDDDRYGVTRELDIEDVVWWTGTSSTHYNKIESQGTTDLHAVDCSDTRIGRAATFTETSPLGSLGNQLVTNETPRRNYTERAFLDATEDVVKTNSVYVRASTTREGHEIRTLSCSTGGGGETSHWGWVFDGTSHELADQELYFSICAQASDSSVQIGIEYVLGSTVIRRPLVTGDTNWHELGVVFRAPAYGTAFRVRFYAITANAAHTASFTQPVVAWLGVPAGNYRSLPPIQGMRVVGSGTAAPTGGDYHAVNDVWLNTATNTTPPAWICAAAGTPGVWVDYLTQTTAQAESTSNVLVQTTAGWVDLGVSVSIVVGRSGVVYADGACLANSAGAPTAILGIKLAGIDSTPRYLDGALTSTFGGLCGTAYWSGVTPGSTATVSLWGYAGTADWTAQGDTRRIVLRATTN